MKRSGEHLDSSDLDQHRAVKHSKSSHEFLRDPASRDPQSPSLDEELRVKERIGRGEDAEDSDVGSGRAHDPVFQEPGDGSATAQSILRQQLSRIAAHHDSRTRMRALCCLHAHLDLPCDYAEREFVLKAIVRHLWREGDPYIAQRMVRVLASLAILCCKSEPGDGIGSRSEYEAGNEDAKRCDEVKERVDLSCQYCPQSSQEKSTARENTILLRTIEPARLGVQTLLAYLAAEDLPISCRHVSTLELQILRSLNRLAEETGAVQLDAINRQVRESLSSSNPFIRAQVLQLIAMVMVTNPGASKNSNLHENDILQTFQDHTRDPDVVVRLAALKSLVVLGRKRCYLTKGCCVAASGLFEDPHGAVRLLALQVVGLWVEQEPEAGSSSCQSNEIFIQVCGKMIDMDISVRVEACKAVCKIGNVNEDLILQSLSKKPLGLAAKEKELSTPSLTAIPEGDLDVSKLEQGLGIHDKLAMGVFMHGIEDEFLEVRTLTVQALARLSNSSQRVCEKALELLLGMLNDDSKQVRSNTLLALLHIAHKWGLAVKDSQLHVFLGTLEDANMEIQSLGKRLLAEIQLSTIDSFKSTIHMLMKNRHEHPKESGVVYALYKLGRAHSMYVQVLADELIEQIKTYLSADGGLDVLGCGCILTLFVASATSDTNIISLVPSKILNLTRLLQQSLPSWSLQLEVEPVNPQVKIFRWLSTRAEEEKEFEATDSRALWLSMLEAPLQIETAKDENTVAEITRGRLPSHVKKRIYGFLESTVKTACNVRSMLEGRMIGKACSVLRCCRKDVKLLLEKAEGKLSPASFALHYIECLILISQGRMHFQPKGIPITVPLPDLSHLCCRLESLVMCMQHAFIGHSMEQRLQLLELSMVPVLWRVASMAGVSVQSEYNKLASAIASIKSISKMGSPLTPFLEGVREGLIPKMGASSLVDSFKVARQLAYSYWPKYMDMSDTLTELKAELFVPGSDFEHPILFSPGAPLGLTIDVAVNTGADNFRIWVLVQLDTVFLQYIFLENEKHEIGQPISTTLQVYGVPNVSKCTLKIALVLECCCADDPKVVARGPKGILLPLTPEKEIHLMATTETLAKSSFM